MGNTTSNGQNTPYNNPYNNPRHAQYRQESSILAHPSVSEFTKNPARYPRLVLVTVLSTGKIQVMTRAEAYGNEKVEIVSNPNDTSKAGDSGFFAQSPQGTFAAEGYSGYVEEYSAEDSEDSENDKSSQDSYDNSEFFVQSPPAAFSIETSSEDSEGCENSKDSEDPEESYNGLNVFVQSPTSELFGENYSCYIEGYTYVSEDAASTSESSEDCQNLEDYEDPDDSYDDF